MHKLTHKGTKVLETKRFTLRPFRNTDGESMYKNYAGDPDVAKYLTWVAHKDSNSCKHLCGLWENESNKPNYYHWAIEMKSMNEIVGSISVVNINPDINEAVIGYCSSKSIWGQGCMTECLKAIIAFLFKDVGFNRIAAYHHVDNPASGKVMLKCAMKYEGTFRQSALTNTGQLCDTKHYAILKADLMSQDNNLAKT